MKATQISTLFNNTAVFLKSKHIPIQPDTGQERNLLNIYPHIQYQSIDSFGGAITDAVAATLEKMPKQLAREVMDAYFGPDGIGYRSIRTHIDSCDFSTEQYAAVNDPLDHDFRHFSLEHDLRRNIRWIKEAYRSAGKPLPVILTPWSPPAFMKTNHSRIGGGHLKKEYYAAWAHYLCRYIQSYQEQEIQVQALTIQNEPNAVQTWDSCLFSAEEERLFLLDYLYPCLIKNHLEHIEIYIWDHNKERLFDRAEAVLTEQALPIVTGAAFHWYSGDHFDALRLVREHFPGIKLISSESCIEYSRFDANQLKHAQLYGHDMIGNLAAGMNMFLDWNICLDEHGGPNYVGNYCHAPVVCHVQEQRLSYQLSFHYISHFSRFIQPFARRIASTVYTDVLEQVAFQNPDQSIVIVIQNQSKEALPLTIRINGQLLSVSILAESITTIVLA